MRRGPPICGEDLPYDRCPLVHPRHLADLDSRNAVRPISPSPFIARTLPAAQTRTQAPGGVAFELSPLILLPPLRPHCSSSRTPSYLSSPRTLYPERSLFPQAMLYATGLKPEDMNKAQVRSLCRRHATPSQDHHHGDLSLCARKTHDCLSLLGTTPWA